MHEKSQPIIILPQEHDLGGFTVRRCLPHAKHARVGPWVFFDHFGPAEFAAGQGVDVRPHPHINLATVTYLFEGEMLHRDSLGNDLTIQPGAVNLMVAGKGIVHSERQRDEIKAQAHRLHGLQLWLGLPEQDEEVDAAFHHYQEQQIPQCNIEGVPVRILIGSAYGETSPVKTYARTLYLEAQLQSGQTLNIPLSEQQTGIYVVSGGVQLAGSQLDALHMAVFNKADSIELVANAETQIAVIGGDILSHRHVWWNFVSSRRERIEQAKADWRDGNFALIPNDNKEFIPLPDE